MIYIPHPNFNFDKATYAIMLFSRNYYQKPHTDLESIDLSKLWSKFEKASVGGWFSFLSEDGCEFGIRVVETTPFLRKEEKSRIVGACSLNFKLTANDFLAYDNVWISPPVKHKGRNVIPKPFVEFLDWLLPQISGT